MLLRLQKYDIELQFTPGTNTPIAGQRLVTSKPKIYVELNARYQIHLLMSNLQVSKNKLQEIRTATASDGVSKKVKEFILDGWPDSKKEIPLEVGLHFQFKSELTIIEDLIFKGERLVTPFTILLFVEK